MKYDIIGDIHGHAIELRALLEKLDYIETSAGWQHPQRTAVFLGDFIDRGPRQLEAINIVKTMVDAGNALAILGNHELNAMAWFTPDPDTPGEFLRPRYSQEYGEKNYNQHKAFLDELGYHNELSPDTATGYNQELHAEIIEWFYTLPLWLEFDDLRVVHACWHSDFMAYLKPTLAPGNRLSPEILAAAVTEPTNKAEKDNAVPSIFKAVEALLKGIEIPLPNGHAFTDKDGHKRTRVRVRWWDTSADTYEKASLVDDELRLKLPSVQIPEHAILNHSGRTPLFFGHYWFTGTPSLISKRVQCLDYSIAKGGVLAAYRFDGEAELSADKLVWVPVSN
jgi:hypothetical protein